MLHGQLQEGHERERKPKGVVNGFRENSGRVPGEFRAESGRVSVRNWRGIYYLSHVIHSIIPRPCKMHHRHDR